MNRTMNRTLPRHHHCCVKTILRRSRFHEAEVAAKYVAPALELVEATNAALALELAQESEQVKTAAVVASAPVLVVACTAVAVALAAELDSMEQPLADRRLVDLWARSAARAPAVAQVV
jgi:hypothetical protein